MEFKGLAGVMMAMARNAEGGEVHVAWPHEKRVVAKLEARGFITVRRTAERCGGFEEWWYRMAPAKKGAK
jgi:hypothetical protein